jgi:hypothetical protein
MEEIQQKNKDLEKREQEKGKKILQLEKLFTDLLKDIDFVLSRVKREKSIENEMSLLFKEKILSFYDCKIEENEITKLKDNCKKIVTEILKYSENTFNNKELENLAKINKDLQILTKKLNSEIYEYKEKLIENSYMIEKLKENNIKNENIFSPQKNEMNENGYHQNNEIKIKELEEELNIRKKSSQENITQILELQNIISKLYEEINFLKNQKIDLKNIIDSKPYITLLSQNSDLKNKIDNYQNDFEKFELNEFELEKVKRKGLKIY